MDKGPDNSTNSSLTGNEKTLYDFPKDMLVKMILTIRQDTIREIENNSIWALFYCDNQWGNSRFHCPAIITMFTNVEEADLLQSFIDLVLTTTSPELFDKICRFMLYIMAELYEKGLNVTREEIQKMAITVINRRGILNKEGRELVIKWKQILESKLMDDGLTFPEWLALLDNFSNGAGIRYVFMKDSTGVFSKILSIPSCPWIIDADT